MLKGIKKYKEEQQNQQNQQNNKLIFEKEDGTFLEIIVGKCYKSNRYNSLIKITFIINVMNIIYYQSYDINKNKWKNNKYNTICVNDKNSIKILNTCIKHDICSV